MKRHKKIGAKCGLERYSLETASINKRLLANISGWFFNRQKGHWFGFAHHWPVHPSGLVTVFALAHFVRYERCG